MSPAGGGGRITLLTDFGTRDGYVAAMRGVIAAIAPDAIVDNASHEIAHGDITAGAFALERYWKLYPPGTVHVVVIDPGVGTARRALVATADGRVLVAPDNGVLTLVLDAAQSLSIREIREPAYLRAQPSSTFHGRDVFAPVAAHIAARVAPDGVGPSIDDPVRLALPSAQRQGDAWVGTILLEDRFGNLITNLDGDRLPAGPVVHIDGRPPIPVLTTYADADPDTLLALIGSSGRLEIAVRDGSAAARLRLPRGTAFLCGPADGS